MKRFKVGNKRWPIKKDILGHIALDCIPNIYQNFIESNNNNMSDEEFKQLYFNRKFIIEGVFK